MNTNTKVVLGAIAALFAVSFIVRFIVLSQAGLTGGWIFYLGLPIGGVVAILLLLLRLGVLNFGESSSATVQHWQHNATAQGPLPVSPPLVTATSQRLQELETLHTNGTISDTEYDAERARLISGI
jgi:hypothetical protein